MYTYVEAVNKALSAKSPDAVQCRQLSAKYPSVLETLSNGIQIGVCSREAMRELLSGVKARLDDLEKASKSAMSNQVLEEAKNLAASENKNGGGAKEFLVHVFDAGSNAKTLNNALKEMSKYLPATAIMALSHDIAGDKVLCLTTVPKVISSELCF